MINPPVCASVRLSVREQISGTAGPIGMKFCVQFRCDVRGLVLLRQGCATLCTSGFMDDVMFGRSGPYDHSTDLASRSSTPRRVAAPGRSLMSVNALFYFHCKWASGFTGPDENHSRNQCCKTAPRRKGENSQHQFFSCQTLCFVFYYYTSFVHFCILPAIL